MSAGTIIRARTAVAARGVAARGVGTFDVLVSGGFLLVAVLLYGGLWSDPVRGYLVDSGQDQNLFEWMFAAQAHGVWHGDNPLHSALQNAPFGINLMANTALPGLAVPLAPLTLAFGPTLTWALVLTGGLAGTAIAWYWVFSRHLVGSVAAAAIGAGFCAFAPPVVSHAKAHPNFVVGFLIPLIVLQLAGLPRRPLVCGIRLGLLGALQVMIGGELLLIAATAGLVGASTMVLTGPAGLRYVVIRPILIGIAAAAVVAGALVAVPLWWQFAGPQSYTRLEHGSVGNDVGALVGYPSQSIAGLLAGGSQPLALNPTEENAFFGWGLVVLVVVLAVWLWRELPARIATITAAVMGLLSLGAPITVGGNETRLSGPWRLLSELPLYESVLESRLALACVPAIGCLLALGTQRVLALSSGRHPDPVSARLLWFGTLTAVLLPLAPVPFASVPRPATPAFFTDGAWQRWVGPGRTLVPVPLPDPGAAEPLRWQIDAGMGFALPQGYFVAPWGQDRQGYYGTAERSSSSLLDDVVETGVVPPVTDAVRAELVADLRFWRADAVVLPDQDRMTELYATLALLLGPGRRDTDVWVWDVRAITR